MGVDRADAGRIDQDEPRSEKPRLAPHLDPGDLALVCRVSRLCDEVGEILLAAKELPCPVKVDDRRRGRTERDLGRDRSDRDDAGRQQWLADERELFLRHPKQVLTREVIFDRVWGYDFGGESNVLEVYIRYLRQKLELENEPRLIHTVRSVGYVLRENP